MDAKIIMSVAETKWHSVILEMSLRFWNHHSPGLDHVYKYEAYCHEQAESPNGKICSAQEIIFSTYPTRGWKDQLFFTSKTVSIIIILYSNCNYIISLKVRFNPSIKFSEIWQCCSTHPNNKILLFIQLFNQKRQIIIIGQEEESR